MDLFLKFLVSFSEFDFQKLQLFLGLLKMLNDSGALGNVVGDFIVDGKHRRFGIVVAWFIHNWIWIYNGLTSSNILFQPDLHYTNLFMPPSARSSNIIVLQINIDLLSNELFEWKPNPYKSQC